MKQGVCVSMCVWWGEVEGRGVAGTQDKGSGGSRESWGWTGNKDEGC